MEWRRKGDMGRYRGREVERRRMGGVKGRKREGKRRDYKEVKR